MLFIGGFAINSRSFKIVLPLAVTINPPASPGSEFKCPTTPDVL